ncbi:MAG TPA: hypothetical protein VNI77_00250, partial [Nitrososphaera sp.]|nr:hypothetical protein [Nitrososphaera sp.]
LLGDSRFNEYNVAVLTAITLFNFQSPLLGDSRFNFLKSAVVKSFINSSSIGVILSISAAWRFTF